MKQDVTWEETLTQMNVRLEVLNEKAKIRIEQIKRTMFKEDDGEKNFALLIDIAKQRMETIKKEYNTFVWTLSIYNEISKGSDENNLRNW